MSEIYEKTLELWNHFLDLSVPLSIELGRTHLKLREILDLEEDSIVRLSRSTGEGVDIRADDKSLFRGEIIIIENRAGVRVNQIITKEKL